MNSGSEEQEERGAEAPSKQGSPSSPDCIEPTEETETMKRAAAKQLIERYYYQLTDGCGQSGCDNEHCASSDHFRHNTLEANQAAVRAIQLAKDKAKLCDPSKPSKVAKNSGEEEQGGHSMRTEEAPERDKDEVPGPSGIAREFPTPVQGAVKDLKSGRQQATSTREKVVSHSGAANTSPSKSFPAKPVPSITEEELHEIIEQCDGEKNWSRLIRTIGSVFCNPEALMQSFLCDTKDTDPLSKEALRSMEEDQDKDLDEQESKGAAAAVSTALHDDSIEDISSASSSSSSPVLERSKSKECPPHARVDVDSLRRAYKELFSIETEPFQASLVNALLYLSRNLEMDLRYHKPYERDLRFLNIFVIVFEIPMLDSPEYLEAATPAICKAAGLLPVAAQAQLCRLWSTYPPERLRGLLDGLQQLITVRVITSNWGPNFLVVDDEGITGAAKVLKILYYASILAGEMDQAEVLEAERAQNEEAEGNLQELLQGAVGHEPKEKTQPREDPLGKELDLCFIDCRAPLIPWVDFINEPLCEQIENNKTIAYFKAESNNKFTFLNHAFLLTPCVKNLGLYFDNRSRMINERRVSLFQSFVHGAPTMPYLRLKIRRDHIIDDALIELEVIAMDNPQDLKKQLYVEFDGEQGIDEGGVSKEFFQLVVEEIFNPDIGMFTHDEETHSFWFNPTSFENDGQFTLIGIVLGLAIYNNIILDVHFPMVVYRKLLGKLGTFEDLKDSHPTLAKSLIQLLEFEGDVEETFMMNFRIGYKDVFGADLTHDLKEKGDTIPVTQDNKQEFVDLYADFLLNKSIEKQFRAFKRGFQMVTEESPLKVLFHPEEVELLVCGSKHFDFHALEEAVEYDGGFNADSATIKHFWEVVHEFDEDQKKKLLQFTTGSDRVPIGGLSKLRLIIARNGPDSDRLPTSHTCFNVLLLPDYRNHDKLKERLLKAINYAKGFGML